MNATFQIVYLLLQWIAEISGFTYNEVNIIAYYIVLPFAYVFLADKLLKKHILKTTGRCLMIIIVIDNYRD